MKKFLMLLSILCCNTVCADTINLDWYVDGNSYAQTTCEIGSGVTLPTEPTKYGYDFIGWSEIFNRGTFANWASVPNSAGDYLGDSNGSNIPQENDYIIVNDASDVPEYGENIEIQTFCTSYSSGWVGGYCRTFIEDIDYGCNGNVYNGNIIITDGVFYGHYAETWQSNTKYIVFKGTKYTPGNVFITIAKGPNLNNSAFESCNTGPHKAKFINDYPYSGKWLLRYHGNWDDLGRGGWVAEKSLD